MSVVLLVAALRFVRRIVRAGVLHPGFDVDRVLVARVAFVEVPRQAFLCQER
ncbi:MAG TPA: hypothetical protein VF424_06620 [Vicinamibacterales bacterium]